MRTPLIVGNWKMNKTIREAVELATKLKTELKGVTGREIVVCPPYIALFAVMEVVKDSNIKLGAQDVCWEKEGAFTGEVSPIMLFDVGCKYVIVGHSERRKYLNETDELINKKLKCAIKFGLIPILCIGETLEERESGLTYGVIKNQLINCLKDITSQEIEKIVIAYEPVWAIGTGKTATPQQAEEAQSFIRNLLSQNYSSIISENIRILYGGSITPQNFPEIMAMENVDGGLVGGASLDPDSFIAIVNYR